MTAQEGRVAVWAEALTWQRTPWVHRAHRKGVGVDCAQFLIAAFSGAGVIDWFDTGEYPRDWHIHRDQERMVPFVRKFCEEIDGSDLQMADIFVCKIGRVYSHAGIIGTWPQGIHAWVPAQIVTLCDLDRDRDLADVPKRYFRNREWL